MEITCVQMDVLISFYIDGELSAALKEKVERHMENCPTCRAKYHIISSIYSDMQEAVVAPKEEDKYSTNTYPSKQYKQFKSNLSAYVDNELPSEESIKMKKFAINNKKARKDLEETYHIRKLMNDSFKKSKSNTKSDFASNIMKQISIEEKENFALNPLIKVAVAFVMTVLILTTIIIFSLSM